MGRYDLHLTEDEFWELTMRELNALSERHEESHEWLNYRAALICSVLANTVRDPKRKTRPFVPDDFMPKTERRVQTTSQMLTTVRMLNTAFGGSEN